MSERQFERCPIAIGQYDFIASKHPLDASLRPIDVCSTVCGERYDAAVDNDNTVGAYDDYNASVDEGCKHWDIEFSHDALHAVDEHTRKYVIVDQCASAGCEMEVGEQAYVFTCPLRAIS